MVCHRKWQRRKVLEASRRAYSHARSAGSTRKARPTKMPHLSAMHGDLQRPYLFDFRANRIARL